MPPLTPYFPLNNKQLLASRSFAWNSSLRSYVAHHHLPRSVNTPTKTSGIGAGKAADLTYWEGAARMIAACSTSSKIIVEKSTVPVKTAEAIGKVCSPVLRAEI